MPLFLQPQDVTAELENAESVLIVPCPICPATSLAMQKEKPVLDLFRNGLKTGALEDHIKSIREPLEERGIRTEVFCSRFPSPLMCIWTKGQRRRLQERAEHCDAAVVLGCSSAVNTVKEALKDTDCKVISGMRMKGVSNGTMRFRFPARVELEMSPTTKEKYAKAMRGPSSHSAQGEPRSDQTSDAQTRASESDAGEGERRRL